MTAYEVLVELILELWKRGVVEVRQLLALHAERLHTIQHRVNERD